MNLNEMKEQIEALQREIESLQQSIDRWKGTVSERESMLRGIGRILATGADREDLSFARRRLYEEESKLREAETQLRSLQAKME